MKITCLGHASFLIEVAGEKILIDPVLHTDPLGSGAFGHTHHREFALEKMPAPTILAITHAHVDHLDPRSLEPISRDTRVVAPNDPETLEELHKLGFEKIDRLDAWESVQLGALRMTATPTDSGVDEVGYLFEGPGARFWHMSDAEATPETGAHIASKYGRCDVVAVKYQPTTRVMSRLFRSLGPAFDKKEVVEWLEAAAETSPKLVFPYASGLSFVGRFAWLNRYLFPYSAEEISELMSARLGPQGRGQNIVAGDIIEIANGEVSVAPQAAEFVKVIPGGGETPWEPIDISRFPGCKNADDRAELAQRLEQIMRGPFVKWIAREGRVAGTVPHALLELGVGYQLAIHLGDGKRLHYAIDFSKQQLSLVNDRLARPNFFVHMAGGSLLDILRKEAGSELLYACGDMLMFEKIIGVRDGKIWIPPVEHMQLYAKISDPLTFYLRWYGPKEGVVAAGSM